MAWCTTADTSHEITESPTEDKPPITERYFLYVK
jgi:hypothetical protein